MYDLSDTASLRSFGSYGSASSLSMAQSGAPELLVSLCYQSLTGRLTVEVLKASNLRNLSMQRAPGKTVA
jgi:synaptotagmin-14/16